MSTLGPESSVSPSGELVLNAETAAEFMAMMRAMQLYSGRTPGQVVAFSEIPRSTVYRYLNPKTTALPKDRDVVEAFARASRLNTIQVNRVLWLWDNLNKESEVVTDDQTAEADVDGPDSHRGLTPQASTPGSTFVVHGNYNVYNSRAKRVKARPDHGDADQDTINDDEPAGPDTDGWDRDTRNGGGGPGGPRDRGHQRGASEQLIQFLLTVLRDRELFLRTIVLIGVMFLGIIAVAVTFHLLGLSGLSLAVAISGVLAIFSSGIAGGLKRRRRR